MKNKGLTFIELVIAVFIIMIASSGAFAILHKIIASTTLSTSSLIASSLAQEGLEIVRNIRDRNWLEESNWLLGLDFCSGPDFCETAFDSDTLVQVSELNFLTINNQGFYGYGGDKQTKFKRGIIIKPMGERILVEVSVQWSEAGRSQEVITQEELYNWH